MGKNEKISDELLAKYMSGQTTPAEEAAVLDYLAESDENLDDFLQMSAAVEANHAPKERTRNYFKWIAVAAAAALLVFVCLFAWKHQKQDNIEFAQKENPAQHTNPVHTRVTDSVEMPTTDVPTTLEKPNELIPEMVEPKNYADSSRKRNYANMIYPSSKLTSISQERKSLIFRWNTDAVDIRFSVKDEKGNLITEKQLDAVKYFPFAIPDDKDTLHWQAVFTYADGTTTVKRGSIIRWDVAISGKNSQNKK
jgi:hypothetical protein